MKNITVIVLSVLVLAIGGGILWYVLFAPTPHAVPSPTNVTLPVSGDQVPTIPATTTASTLFLTANDGGTVPARNFLQDPTTRPDPVNDGFYQLGDSQTYAIIYIAFTQFFTIELLEEPIGETRHQAETYLLDQLGITQSEMCRLNYQVSTPSSVNSLYGGQELAFSFCPGATKLPQ